MPVSIAVSRFFFLMQIVTKLVKCRSRIGATTPLDASKLHFANLISNRALQSEPNLSKCVAPTHFQFVTYDSSQHATDANAC